MWPSIGSRTTRTTRAAKALRSTRTFSPVVMSRSSVAVLTARRGVMPGSTRVTRPARTVLTASGPRSFSGKSIIRTTGAMRNCLLVSSLFRLVWAGLARRARGDRRRVCPFTPFRPDSCRTREHPMLGLRRHTRSTIVHRSKKFAIGARSVLVPTLQCRLRSVPFARPGKLLRRRLGSSSAAPAIEADIVHRHVFDDGLVVGMNDDGPVHLSDGGIVEEHPVIPISALVAYASITEAVVDAAVISHVRPPISGVPNISGIIVAPVARRPEQPDNRWQHPGARDPVITNVSIGPVAWRPYVAGAWTERLLVDGKNGRSDAYG